jgi:hypothetical protein
VGWPILGSIDSARSHLSARFLVAVNDPRTRRTVVGQVSHGCTIGMGSVVVADVPDHAVVVGNPARLLLSHTAW